MLNPTETMGKLPASLVFFIWVCVCVCVGEWGVLVLGDQVKLKEWWLQLFHISSSISPTQYEDVRHWGQYIWLVDHWHSRILYDIWKFHLTPDPTCEYESKSFRIPANIFSSRPNKVHAVLLEKFWNHYGKTTEIDQTIVKITQTKHRSTRVPY